MKFVRFVGASMLLKIGGLAVIARGKNASARLALLAKVRDKP